MIMEELKELRKRASLTQSEAASLFGISRKTYIKYENHPEKANRALYKLYCDQLRELSLVDEEHGILSLDDIKDNTKSILDKYDVTSCILFGSYAKGKAREDSDIDMIVDCDISGLAFFGLVEELREALHKKIDLLDISQLLNNKELLSEVLKDGIRIYG